MSHDISRRGFLGASAAVGFYVATSEGLPVARAAVEKLNIAAVGVGGKGDSDSSQAAKFGNLVAICDIDEKRLDKKGTQFPKARSSSTSAR